MFLCFYVSMHVSKYLCLYVSMCLCIYVCICACMYVCMYVSCRYLFMYLCTYLCIYLCMYESIYIYTKSKYICAYLCRYKYICIYIHITYMCINSLTNSLLQTNWSFCCSQFIEWYHFNVFVSSPWVFSGGMPCGDGTPTMEPWRQHRKGTCRSNVFSRAKMGDSINGGTSYMDGL